MAVRTRFQWVTAGDTLLLDMYNYSGNMPADLVVNAVRIYKQNAATANENNPLGLQLVGSPLAADRVANGHYRVQLDVDPVSFQAGAYRDIWDLEYADGATGARDFPFIIYAERQVATTYPPTITWSVSVSPKKVHYDTVCRLACRIKPAELIDRDATEYWVQMLQAGTVEMKIVRMHSVYDYVACEDGGDDDVNASLQWTQIVDRGDGIYTFLLDASPAGLNMYPGEYAMKFRVTFADTIWYATEKLVLQITR